MLTLTPNLGRRRSGADAVIANLPRLQAEIAEAEAAAATAKAHVAEATADLRPPPPVTSAEKEVSKFL